jgi:hypothetical protein
VAKFRNSVMLHSKIDIEVGDNGQSGRHGRFIGGDEEAAMEHKEPEGWF